MLRRVGLVQRIKRRRVWWWPTASIAGRLWLRFLSVFLEFVTHFTKNRLPTLLKQSEHRFDRNPTRHWSARRVFCCNELPTAHRANRVLIQTQTKPVHNLNLFGPTICANQHSQCDWSLHFRFARFI